MSPTKPGINFRELALLEVGDSIGLLPVIEKELIHYDILRAMSENGFLGNLCFQGGTSLRLCYGSERFSEDLDFTGGVHFDSVVMSHLKECIEDHLSGKYGLSVEVKTPKEVKETGIKVSSWQVKVITAPGRPDIPSQKIKIEVANVPSYTRDLVQISQNYQFSIGAPLIVGVQSMEEIMADKLLALPASVSHVRHRDIWDLHWMSMNRVHPNSDLLEKKIHDYGVVDYQEKLKARIESLPSIVNGAEFLNQMSRFLRCETVEKTIGSENFRASLIGSITRILSANLGAEIPFELKDADVERGRYRGEIIEDSGVKVTQAQGKNIVIAHEKGRLIGDVQVGQKVEIGYKDGKGIVKSLEKIKDIGRGID